MSDTKTILRIQSKPKQSKKKNKTKPNKNKQTNKKNRDVGGGGGGEGWEGWVGGECTIVEALSTDNQLYLLTLSPFVFL